MEKLQLSLPVILQEEQTREELLMLPREALELLFSNSETCLSEFQLFQVIEKKLLQLSGDDSTSQQMTEAQKSDLNLSRSVEELRGKPLMQLRQHSTS